MYNKLKEQAEKELMKTVKEIYFKYNEIIDNNAEQEVLESMSTNNTSWVIFNEHNPHLNYTYIFTQLILPPYDKPIIRRLEEKFPPPEFKCVSSRVHIAVKHKKYNYYMIYVDWTKSNDFINSDECECILF